jgi:hypothetical protein
MKEDRERINGWRLIFGMQKGFKWKTNGGLRYPLKVGTKHAELYTD